MGRNPLVDYIVDGERFPSVTEVLSLGGLNPYKDADPKLLRRAARRGHQVHWITEQVDLYRVRSLEQVPANRRGFALAYCRFCHRERYRPILTEKVVISRRHRFAGRPDRYCMIHDGERHVIDIKAVDDEGGKDIWGLQTAAYEIAIRECYGIKRSVKIKRKTLCLLWNGSYRLQDWPMASDHDRFIELAASVNARLAAGEVKLPKVVLERDDFQLEAA